MLGIVLVVLVKTIKVKKTPSISCKRSYFSEELLKRMSYSQSMDFEIRSDSPYCLCGPRQLIPLLSFSIYSSVELV